MALDIPAGTRLFVDANIFHYAFVPTFDISPVCQQLLERIEAGEVKAVVSPQVIADTVHKVMCSEAVAKFRRERQGLMSWLKQHPLQIAELTEYGRAQAHLETLTLEVLSTDMAVINEAARISKVSGLLTGDAVIVALMRRHNIQHIATNDNDFDRVTGLRVWKPR